MGLKRATDARGGTKLYNALNYCVSMPLIAEAEAGENDTWIVALTDGASSDNPFVVERIRKLNEMRVAQIHLIIVGFEVPAKVVETCKGVCTVTEQSIYI